MAPTPAPLPDQLTFLIIRFASALPDLTLPIASPRTNTTLVLKQLIRPHLPDHHAAARLRLIYAGKVLADSAPLSLSLRLPPSRDTHYIHHQGNATKGKQPVRMHDDEMEDEGGGHVHLARDAPKYYLHCSLGDTLSASELAYEASLAHDMAETLIAQLQSTRSGSSSSSTPTARHPRFPQHATPEQRRSPASASTSLAPQGFDRLLASGFTAYEVSALRTHFTTNLSYTRTPDAMPSPTTLRRLEDAWLDSTATDAAPTATGSDDAGWGAGFAVEDGGLDDMMWGYLTGFFWPLGALVWGFREEGVWARRRQLAVVMGVLFNAAFGFMRWSQ